MKLLSHDDIPARGKNYEYRAEQGPVNVSPGNPVRWSFSGSELIAIREHQLHDTDVLRAASRLLRWGHQPPPRWP